MWFPLNVATTKGSENVHNVTAYEVQTQQPQGIAQSNNFRLLLYIKGNFIEEFLYFFLWICNLMQLRFAGNFL